MGRYGHTQSFARAAGRQGGGRRGESQPWLRCNYCNSNRQHREWCSLHMAAQASIEHPVSRRLPTYLWAPSPAAKLEPALGTRVYAPSHTWALYAAALLSAPAAEMNSLSTTSSYSPLPWPLG